ncbi:pilus assembly protein N-terminal domain-containing protein [Pseudomonas sp. TH31]|nr:pilus assembly protein N-terminal domain-containing protein [Pseudomonas sp. TH31]
MQSRSGPKFKPVFGALMLKGLSINTDFAMTGNCTALGRLPPVIEIGEGLQQDVQSPVAITRLAVGYPKIADVQANGSSSFLFTGMASGATSLMVWTACASEPRQSMVFVQGKATATLTNASVLPSLPGEKLRNYDPNFYRMFFLENGNFDKRNGLSQ